MYDYEVHICKCYFFIDVIAISVIFSFVPDYDQYKIFLLAWISCTYMNYVNLRILYNYVIWVWSTWRLALCGLCLQLLIVKFHKNRPTHHLCSSYFHGV